MPHTNAPTSINSDSEPLTLSQLTGQDDSLLIPLPASLLGIRNSHSNKTLLGHPEAIEALLELQAKAENDQQTFQVISSYRNYEQQKNIWNRKYTGELTILDTNEQPVDISKLKPLEIVQSIMLYSALPGASRHHWGSDFDLFPMAAISGGHEVQLLASEFTDTGIAGAFNQWMDENLHQTPFFRPYARFQQGIAYEPWHVSYHPLADKALSHLTIDKLLNTLENDDLEARDCICANLEALYKRYVSNICSP